MPTIKPNRIAAKVDRIWDTTVAAAFWKAGNHHVVTGYLPKRVSVAIVRWLRKSIVLLIKPSLGGSHLQRKCANPRDSIIFVCRHFTQASDALC